MEEGILCEKCKHGQDYWKQASTISNFPPTGGTPPIYLGRLCCEHAVQNHGFGIKDV